MQVRAHNHNLSKALYTALCRNKDVITNELLAAVDAFIETNTSMTFTPQRIRNLMNYRLGGASTEERLKILIGQFLLEDGNSCLIIEDEWGLTCGVVVQSNAQKNLFKHWGDNLVLDWTHNTNNMGFYL
ncbi:hypothetical protein PHMEG_0004412, partial [Phytophthora megakarya]